MRFKLPPIKRLFLLIVYVLLSAVVTWLLIQLGWFE